MNMLVVRMSTLPRRPIYESPNKLVAPRHVEIMIMEANGGASLAIAPNLALTT